MALKGKNINQILKKCEIFVFCVCCLTTYIPKYYKLRKMIRNGFTTTLFCEIYNILRVLGTSLKIFVNLRDEHVLQSSLGCKYSVTYRCIL